MLAASLFLLVAACAQAPQTGPDEVGAPQTRDKAVQAGVDQAATADTTGVPQAAVGHEEGWGAVLARDGSWYRTTTGDLAAGARAVVPLSGSGQQGACGEGIAPATGAMIIPPAGSPTPEIVPAPVVRAALVERAVWRLDELLPEADLFSPLVTTPDPTKGRGVELGSVAKVRRELAPPVLIAAGVRDCTGALAILDVDAGKVLTWHRIDGACETLRVLPPTDLDGDGHRELAAWSRSRVTLYRLTEGPGDPSLTLLADWTCR